MSTYQMNNISFDAPEAWSDLSVITVVAPVESGFRPNAVVTRDHFATDNTVADYAAAQASALAEQLTGYEGHRSESSEAAGKAAHLLEHSFDIEEGGMRVRQIQVFIAAEKTMYALSLTNAEDSFDETRALFEGIVQSFRIQ